MTDANHIRVARARGKAREHLCFEDCGQPAVDWSQTHGTSGENPEDFEPRCRRCHVIYDKHQRHSEEANQKRSTALIGRKFSEETLSRMSETRKKDPQTSERASRAAKARAGIPWSESRRAAYERNKK